MGVSAGYDFTIGHYFCRDKNNNDHFVEFNFWGLNSWSQARELGANLVPIYDESFSYSATDGQKIFGGQEIPVGTGQFQGSLRTPFPMAGTTELADPSNEQKTLSLAFNYGTGQTFHYYSSMNNFELNGRFGPRGVPDRLVLHPDGRWRRECQPGVYMSYLYGLRYMLINENFTFHSTSYGPYGNVWDETPQDAVGDYNIKTHNNLLGIQLGVEMTFRKCRWEWGFHAKAGPCVNFCSQSSTIDAEATDGTARTPFHRYLAASAVSGRLDRRDRRPGHLQVQAQSGRARRPTTSCGFRAWPWRPNNCSSPPTPSIGSAAAAPSSARAYHSAWNGCGDAKWANRQVAGGLSQFSCQRKWDCPR